MKKLFMFGIVFILLSTLVFSIECQRKQTNENIPCEVISSWNPGTCSNYNATIYNSSGIGIKNVTWQEYYPVCYFNFTQTQLGTYCYNSTIESGCITLEEDANMQIGLVIAIGLIVALFMWLAFKLEESHGMLKLLLLFISIGLITIIPSVFLTSNAAVIFNNAIMIFTWIFWLYVGVYFIWWIFQKFQTYVPR